MIPIPQKYAMIVSEPTSKKKYKIVIVLALLFGLGFICFSGYQYIEGPHYIPVHPSLIDSEEINWSYSERSVVDHLGTGFNPRHFILRMEGSASRKMEGKPWESVVAYFDTRLSQDGWTRLPNRVPFDPCFSHLPEADFLPEGPEGFVVYRQPPTYYDREEPTVCLAVWRPFDGRASYYEIVLMTINPSWATKLESELDLPDAPTVDFRP